MNSHGTLHALATRRWLTSLSLAGAVMLCALVSQAASPPAKGPKSKSPAARSAGTKAGATANYPVKKASASAPEIYRLDDLPANAKKPRPAMGKLSDDERAPKALPHRLIKAAQPALRPRDEEVPVPPSPGGATRQDSLMFQTEEQAQAKSYGCLACHQGIEPMHTSKTVQLGCCDCHGGDPTATTKECAHVPPKYPESWPSSANPERTYALLNLESPEFVRFVNPGDWRAANISCGTTGCHETEVHNNRKSIMGHSAMVPGSALYNNGSVPNKIYRWGEVYSEGGRANRVFSTPAPTNRDYYVKGVLPWIDPVPAFQMTQPGNIFRVLEINNNATSLRGPGTDFRQDAVFLNVVKTKLNDPTMTFLGNNDHPGDFRSSGCTSCHVLYANDRDPVHSAHIANFGNKGFTATGDRSIPRGESGHPIKHQLTRVIPSSQCMTCHFHQGSGALANYYGYMWWDYESDADQVYSRYGNPIPGGAIGEDSNKRMYDLAPDVNPHIKGNEFADFHNVGWIMQAVYQRDKKGNLVDDKGKQIPKNDPDWHKRAVHLSDIHLQKGMHCIDCHFKQDSHGDGKLYGTMIDAVEINCRDCHGTVQTYANLITSNHPGGNDLTKGTTPFGDQRFYKKGEQIMQRSAVSRDKEWEVVQVKDVVTPGHAKYNKDAHYAKTVERDGVTWGKVEEADEECKRAHTDTSMNCYACHSSWNTTCAGCHLDAKTNVRAEMNHYDAGFTKVYAAYNPQAMRSDGFFLGKNGSVKGNLVSPVRSASGVVVSAAAGNRQMVVHQQPTIAAEGNSGHAFSPNPPHTVGGKGATRKCTDCHVADKGDNNATMASVLGLGIRGSDFIGRYVWIAEGHRGIEAVRIAAGEEAFPNPIIGSNLHRLVDAEGYRRHYQEQDGQLRTAYHHRSRNARSIVHVGEWMLVADGKHGFQVLDTANVHNKDVANHIVTAGLSPLGQRQHVPTKDATSVAMAVNLPTDAYRTHRPENQEQPLHPLFRYAYVTDSVEGLILIEINTLFDGNPSNNFLRRTVTFNPDGILSGAVDVKIHGTYAYVLTCHDLLVVVDISEPCNPTVVAKMGAPALNGPRAIDIQFRFAFICDSEGLKVVDITSPFLPTLVAAAPIRDARDVVIMRTYAYIAAGPDGLAVLDVENPTTPGGLRFFTAQGCINDATALAVETVYGSFFVHLADGVNGLRVIQVVTPADGHESKGFSPDPNPRLVATYRTKGPAIAVAEGMPRDHYVDIDGNQFSVFGRLGSRPFNYEEMKRMYLRGGKLYTVTDEPPELRTALPSVPRRR